MEGSKNYIVPAIAVTVLYTFYKIYKRRHVIRDIKRKKVFITGCDSGFGYLLALRLHQHGFRVWAGCLNESGEGASTLREKGLSVIQLDVTKQDDVDQAIRIIKSHPELDGLHAIVNNAGVVAFGEAELLPIKDFQRLMEVNYMGTVRVTKACLPLLREIKGSRVINVASLMGSTSLSNLSGYCASKFAVEAFSLALEQELRKWEIHVCIVEPGPYDTSIGVGEMNKYINYLWDNASPETRKSYGRNFFDEYANSSFPSSPHVHEVIDALENAIIARKPKTVYRIGYGSCILPLISWLNPTIFKILPVWFISKYTFYNKEIPSLLQ